MSTFRNDFAKILAKPHPNCHVVCGKLPPIIMIWCVVRVRRIEEDMRWGRLPSMWGIELTGRTKFSSERNLKWQRCLCYKLSTFARRIRRACACWARDKVRDFLEYFKFHENSEIDMSYQTFFFPSRKLRPQRTSGSQSLVVTLQDGFCF